MSEAASAERQIANLVYALAEAIDDGDHDRIEELFGEATFQLDDREPRVGGAAFRKTIERSMIHYDDGTPRTLHVVTNLRVELEEHVAAARAGSYVTVFQSLADFPLQAVMTGRYSDRFAQDGTGAWRWVERRMRVDHVGDTSRHTNTSL